MRFRAITKTTGAVVAALIAAALVLFALYRHTLPLALTAVVPLAFATWLHLRTLWHDQTHRPLWTRLGLGSDGSLPRVLGATWDRRRKALTLLVKTVPGAPAAKYIKNTDAIRVDLRGQHIEITEYRDPRYVVIVVYRVAPLDGDTKVEDPARWFGDGHVA